MSTSRTYLPHVHNFRGFAITLIIATHCLSIFDWSSTPTLELLLKRLVANGTILFLFIAGFLFQHLSDKYEVRDYLWKKTRFVVLPYLFVSVPALLLFTVVMQRTEVPPGFYDLPTWRQVTSFLLTGSHLAPFWFIPVFVSRGSYNPAKSFVHFLPVWMLGMACSRHRETATRWLSVGFWWLLVAFIFFFALEFVYSVGTHSWYSSIGKIILTLFLFEAFRRWGDGSARWFALAGTLSFGLFFVHSYVISAGKLVVERFVGAQPAGNLLLYLASVVVAVFLSIAAVQGARRLLGRYSRNLIGV
ncbi:acyltransferase family protein [Thauera sp. WH-2]|uniref:acyltransferase family protein n=1 Tax=Thauera sp. WH-2 TaxID=3401574 RepID=UPI003AAB09F0